MGLVLELIILRFSISGPIDLIYATFSEFITSFYRFHRFHLSGFFLRFLFPASLLSIFPIVSLVSGSSLFYITTLPAPSPPSHPFVST